MSYMSWMRERVPSMMLGVAILIVVTLACIGASIYFAVSFVQDTIALVANNLSSRSGISFLLVKGAVILGTIPFFWAIGKFTKNVWGLLNFGWDSMALYKNKYGLVVVGYVGLYFLVMYGASLQAYQYKFCADTPEGIFTADTPGRDPVYGIELKACSRTQTLALRAGNGHLTPPREVLVQDAGKFEWFDRVTGQPRIWYSSTSDGNYRFFDAHGVDPYSRQELKPVTMALVERIKHQQSTFVAQQQAEQKKAEEAKQKDLATAQGAQQQAQQQLEMASLARQAESSFESKDYQAAFDACSRVLDAAPQNRTCVTVKQHASVKLAEQLVNEGMAHWEKGEFDETTWCADKALEIDHDNKSAIKLKRLASQLKDRVAQ